MNYEQKHEEPLMLQRDCADCIYYDVFGSCIEKGYNLKENCEIYKKDK